MLLGEHHREVRDYPQASCDLHPWIRPEHGGAQHALVPLRGLMAACIDVLNKLSVLVGSSGQISNSHTRGTALRHPALSLED